MTEKPEKEGARILVGKFDGTGETKIARNRQKWCSHRRFALDAEAREVRCQGCGKLLDPFEILFEYATEERSFENWRQSVIDQGKKLAELRAEEKRIKARTKERLAEGREGGRRSRAPEVDRRAGARALARPRDRGGREDAPEAARRPEPPEAAAAEAGRLGRPYVGRILRGIRMGRTGMKHGTRYAYRTGCRCAACRAWQADRMRRYRRHRPQTRPHPLRRPWPTRFVEPSPFGAPPAETSRRRRL